MSYVLHDNGRRDMVANNMRIKEKLDVSHIESKDGILIASPVTFQDKICVSQIDGENGVTILSPITFTGPVHGIELIKMVECDACEYEHPGFQIDNKTICLECIRDMAIQFRAKESWANQNGDPMKNCFDMIKTLQDELKQCKEEIIKLKKPNTTITSGEFLSQYL